MVAVRKAIEMTYNCTCDVIQQTKYKKSDKSTGFKDEKILENQKCKLSFETISNVSQDGVKANVKQIIKLFIAPEITIKSGSRIDVKNETGQIVTYKSSGKPAIYPNSHQEIVLKLDERFA